MNRHYNRDVYFMVGEKPIVGSPLSAASPTNVVIDKQRDFKFGRMFDKLSTRNTKTKEAQEKDVAALVELGNAMNPKSENVDDDHDTSIPSGYTYLGQFIAHEISFDKTKITDFPTATIDDLKTIEQGRTPSLDLDGLYGLGPKNEESQKCYEKDGFRLKVGRNFGGVFQNDLPREREQAESLGQALIADPRNDENLLVAQTHVALIKFHNKVVEEIREKEPGLSGPELFKKAQERVIKHFQWIVLYDFLPQIIDKNKLDEAINGDSIFKDGEEMFMPVEFSGAAFRFGHSMVRNSYELNMIHNSVQSINKVPVKEFFRFTNFSGGMKTSLESQWIVDWRNFYDFKGIYEVGDQKLNVAKKIDTTFNLKIEGLPSYPHPTDKKYGPLTVRNLIRGYALGLPSGQEVADFLVKSGRQVKKLSKEDLLDSPHRAVLRDYGFEEQTPLWYYILKEAEMNGGSHLGDVGSFIVAETFAGILRNSTISILKDKDWRPSLPEDEPERFAMTYLLNSAKVIDPVGEYEKLTLGVHQ